MWIKLRLAPMCPYIGSISLAFVEPPIIKVQLLPYNRVRIMRIPVLQVSLSACSLSGYSCTQHGHVLHGRSHNSTRLITGDRSNVL